MMDQLNKSFGLDHKEKNQCLEEQNQCPICFGDLDIYVEMIPSTHQLREEARCVNCMALSRVANHIVH